MDSKCEMIDGNGKHCTHPATKIAKWRKTFGRYGSIANHQKKVCGVHARSIKVQHQNCTLENL